MNKLLIIGGPTGVGKSELAVKLAQRYGDAIIVGADSMQIYKGMDIGTGKISKDEMKGIRHTMIDIVQPNDDFSVQKYVENAKQIIDSALACGTLPIVVGGTGMYINALINEQNFADAPPNPQIRKKYYDICEQRGAKYLHEILQNADPESAKKIPESDVKRTVRALEIYELTGRSKSEIVTTKKSEYDVKFFVLDMERTKLYERINSRVDKMLSSGLIEEVISLKEYWQCKSMQAIGYTEIIKKLHSGNDPLLAADEIKQNTRRYAKRQMTFLRWIDADKTYASEDFYENVSQIADKWLEE